MWNFSRRKLRAGCSCSRPPDPHVRSFWIARNPVAATERYGPPIVPTIAADDDGKGEDLDLLEEEMILTSSRICWGERSCGRRRGCRSSRPRCHRRRRPRPLPRVRARPPQLQRRRRRPPRPAARPRRRRAPATRSAPLSAGPTSRASPPIL